jgi:hypothetical protein
MEPNPVVSAAGEGFSAVKKGSGATEDNGDSVFSTGFGFGTAAVKEFISGVTASGRIGSIFGGSFTTVAFTAARGANGSTGSSGAAGDGTVSDSTGSDVAGILFSLQPGRQKRTNRKTTVTV